jgi:hypothetical protein
MDSRRRLVAVFAGSGATIASTAVLMNVRGNFGDLGAGLVIGVAAGCAIAGAIVFRRGAKSCPGGSGRVEPRRPGA